MPETEHLALIKIFLPLFLLIFFPVEACSQVYPDEKVHLLMKSGIEKIVSQKYDEAEEIFLNLDKNYPHIPPGKIYSAAVEITRAYDYGINFDSDYINDNLEKAFRLCEDLLEKDPGNKWNIYFSGLAEGYKAYFNALEGNMLTALNHGFNAMQKFEKCLSADSSFYEACTALGIYKYWKSSKTDFLNWLPFFNDERDEGIKNIIHSLNHFTYNRHLAANSLLWIYIDKKDFKKAAVLAEEMVRNYPVNRQFKWGLGRAYEEISRVKAIAVYNEILDSYKKLKLSNRSQEITIMHIIAQQYDKEGNKTAALKICRSILGSDLSAETRDKLGKRLSRIEEMERSLSGN
jgi:tetratricopeptide (TPR) repeat protein